MGGQTPQVRIEGKTRIVLRPLASPLPLAFFAFGAGSLMLSGLQLGIIPASETRSFAAVQAAFVFPRSPRARSSRTSPARRSGRRSWRSSPSPGSPTA